MKLLNWNIQSGGGKRVPGILAAIAAHRPALVVITEFRTGVSGNALRQGLDALGLIHQRTAIAEYNKNSVLVASARPLQDSTLSVPQELARHVLTVKIDKVELIAAFCAKDEIGKPFAAYLAQCLPSPGKPLIATGDFLYGPLPSDAKADRHLRVARAAGWVDTLRTDGRPDPGWSFRGNRGGRSAPDHLWVSPDLASDVLSARFSPEELDSVLSDHAPLLAEFQPARFPVF